MKCILSKHRVAKNIAKNRRQDAVGLGFSRETAVSVHWSALHHARQFDLRLSSPVDPPPDPFELTQAEET